LKIECELIYLYNIYLIKWYYYKCYLYQHPAKKSRSARNMFIDTEAAVDDEEEEEEEEEDYDRSGKYNDLNK